MKKIISVRGRDVGVETFDQPAGDGSLSKLVRATLAGITVEGSLTIGAVDGPRPMLSTVQLQKDLDDLRQRLADEAAWYAERAELLQQVQ